MYSAILFNNTCKSEANICKFAPTKKSKLWNKKTKT